MLGTLDTPTYRSRAKPERLRRIPLFACNSCRAVFLRRCGEVLISANQKLLLAPALPPARSPALAPGPRGVSSHLRQSPGARQHSRQHGAVQRMLWLGEAVLRALARRCPLHQAASVQVPNRPFRLQFLRGRVPEQARGGSE